MEKLNELVEQAKFVADWHGSDWSSALCQDKDGKQAHEIICESRGEAVISTGSNSNEASWLCDYLELCSPANILAIAEVFRALEQEKTRLKSIAMHANRGWKHAYETTKRAEAAEAKLAELEKQASEQKPFMYGIMTANGDAHFEDFCVSSDPSLLEDVIWEWNNTLADNEPKNRVVGLFTRPAPAINLAELLEVSANKTADQIYHLFDGIYDDRSIAWSLANDVWDACHAAILRNIEEAK